MLEFPVHQFLTSLVFIQIFHMCFIQWYTNYCFVNINLSILPTASLWDGNIVVPNFYTLRREVDENFGPIEDDRKVQGKLAMLDWNCYSESLKVSTENDASFGTHVFFLLATKIIIVHLLIPKYQFMCFSNSYSSNFKRASSIPQIFLQFLKCLKFYCIYYSLFQTPVPIDIPKNNSGNIKSSIVQDNFCWNWNWVGTSYQCRGEAWLYRFTLQHLTYKIWSMYDHRKKFWSIFVRRSPIWNIISIRGNAYLSIESVTVVHQSTRSIVIGLFKKWTPPLIKISFKIVTSQR